MTIYIHFLISNTSKSHLRFNLMESRLYKEVQRNQYNFFYRNWLRPHILESKKKNKKHFFVINLWYKEKKQLLLAISNRLSGKIYKISFVVYRSSNHGFQVKKKLWFYCFGTLLLQTKKI